MAQASCATVRWLDPVRGSRIQRRTNTTAEGALVRLRTLSVGRQAPTWFVQVHSGRETRQGRGVYLA